MKTVLLCGGVGKRMFPIEEDKFLLDFLGKPLLQHQMEMAREAGLNEFVIIGNPGNIERIERIAGTVSEARVDLVVQERPLGIADALGNARQFLEDTTLVVNPNDVFSGAAYSRIVSESNSRPGSSFMLGCRVKEYFPGGYLEVDAAGDLQHIVEKPGEGNEPSDLVNILVHLHSDAGRLLDYIQMVQTDRDDVYECALDDMVKDGHSIAVIPYEGFWAPIKYPWHVFTVAEHFLDGADRYISPIARVSDRATVEGKVILCDNVRVLENAVVRGPVYVGPNSVIGNNALVRDYTHIGANCVVGFSTEVKHSYIGQNCWFHSNYVGDSVIDDDCSFGAGTITANFRLDEARISMQVGGAGVDTGYDKLGVFVGRGCRTGVNASFMPGVRVGANCFVGPQICLSQDIEADKKVLPKPQYRVLSNDAELDRDKREELLRKLAE